VTTPLLERVAGAPISWGVCEVPGWGHQLDSERVLSEMRAVGISATEFGPDGFLPEDPQTLADTLAGHGLGAVGGFVPVLLHDRGHDPQPGVDHALDAFLAAGAGVLVLAAASGADGYDARPELDEADWQHLLGTLDRLAEHAAGRGVRACLHPHVGTMVETAEEVRRVLDGSEVPLCLDTGHLLIGGTDPVALAREAPGRVAHTHLKDVDGSWAERVRAGESTYTEAVAAGMYRPLGQGDVDIATIVTTLEAGGYDGWYVMEQDTVLGSVEDAEAALHDVRTSVDFLRALAAR
jgi:inosose dehydratase